MTDELRIALAVANITKATRETGEDYASQFGTLKPRALADCIVTLAAEVKRLHTAVEAVRALPRYDYEDTYMAMRRHGDWIDCKDVLAALGVTDD